MLMMTYQTMQALMGTDLNHSVFYQEDPKASVIELERCVNSKKMLGAMVATNVNGMDWDDNELYPVLEAANDLKCIIFSHAGSSRLILKNYHLKILSNH